jgi:nucleoid-associated protein YgaU
MTERPQPLTHERPAPFPSDSWDFDPDEDLPNDPYRGVRRAGIPRRRLPVVVGIAAATIAAGMVFFGPLGGGGRQQSVGSGADDTPPSSGAFDSGATASASAPSALPSPPVPTRAGATAAPAGNASAQTTVRPFTTLVYEAEAGMPDVKVRSAQVVAQNGASGGKMVQFSAGSGEMQFRFIHVPSAGTYRFAIYYAPGNAVQVGHLAVGGGTPLNVTFVAGSGCCLVSTVDTAIQPGIYTSTLSVSAVDDKRPAIDRIVISRP